MNRKVILLGLPILLLAGGAGAYMTGQLDPLLGTEPAAEPEVVEEPALPPIGTEFVELKDLGVSVIRDGIVFEVVYVDLALEVIADAKSRIDRHRPHLLDRVQAALREVFAYRSRMGLPPIEIAEMKSVVLQVTRHMFGEEAIVDAHLISDWVTQPGT